MYTSSTGYANNISRLKSRDIFDNAILLKEIKKSVTLVLLFKCPCTLKTYMKRFPFPCFGGLYAYPFAIVLTKSDVNGGGEERTHQNGG